MIDHKHKVIFIHIPKCAGQSVENYFLRLRGLEARDRSALGLFTNPKNSSFERANDHLRLSGYEHSFGGSIPPDYRIFTIVRNPYTRFESEMRYRFHGRLSPRTTVRLASVLPTVLRDLGDHLRPQSDYVRGDAECRVEILRFESIALDFAGLCRQWDLGDGRLPHLNRTVSSGYSGRQGDWLREHVRATYEIDFDRFGYAP